MILAVMLPPNPKARCREALLSLSLHVGRATVHSADANSPTSLPCWHCR